MADHFLTTTQKNAVLGAIREAGLDPAEFMWGTMRTEATKIGPGQDPMDVPMLMHTPTGYFFMFDFFEPRAQHWATFVPGREASRERINAGGWNEEMSLLGQWLEIVKREYGAPDLWAELGREREDIARALPPHEQDNTPFTPDERAQISGQLRELKEYLRTTHELTAEQFAAIDSRLDYFERAGNRMQRIDWANAFVGSLVSLALQAIVPVGPIQDALRFVFSALRGLFGGGPPELHS